MDPPPESATVGNGTDYSAVVAGKISSATGSFDNVSSGITETGQFNDSGPQLANTFTLQLNSQFFYGSPACSGAAIPGDCEAWQQFVYEDDQYNIVFMQYWLIFYDTTCPSGWNTYSYTHGSNHYTDCYMDSPQSIFSGSALTAADLATAQFSGTAAAGGNDGVVLVFGSDATLVTNQDSTLDLAANWNTAEFNVVGDAGSGQANFGSNTTLDPQVTLSDSSLSAPTCDEVGFTGETNNLSLTGTPSIGTQGLPTMLFDQTNESPTTASCASGPGSLTTTTVSTSLSGGSSSGASITVPTATAVTDQATLSGTNASVATGTVTYNVYSNASCSVLVNGGTAQAITTAGTLPASASVTLGIPGTYYWQASYSGDTYNSASKSSCGAEIETVKSSPTLATTSSGNGLSGGTFSDSATLSGSSGTITGETVGFSLYPSLTDCTGTTGALSGSPVSAALAVNGVTPQSGLITVPSAGTYYWQATYGGDSSNNAASSTCSSEVVTVT
ncbi:MAG TPA: hypothetical protein VGG38_09490, partial [Acidimicrobiales bacterium]